MKNTYTHPPELVSQSVGVNLGGYPHQRTQRLWLSGIVTTACPDALSSRLLFLQRLNPLVTGGCVSGCLVCPAGFGKK